MENTINLYLPGTIWQRTRRGKTSTVMLLAVTNEHLSEKVQATHPKQAVFLDSKGRWCTLELEAFKRDRTLVSTDAVVSDNLARLLEDREDNLTVDDDPIAVGEQEQEQGQVTEQEQNEVNVLFKSFNQEDLTSKVQNAIVSYIQRPRVDNNSRALVHELILDPTVLKEEDAVALFSTNDSLDNISYINVEGEDYMLDTYLGSYPLLVDGAKVPFYTMYFETDVTVPNVAEELGDTIVDGDTLVVLPKNITIEMFEDWVASLDTTEDINVSEDLTQSIDATTVIALSQEEANDVTQPEADATEITQLNEETNQDEPNVSVPTEVNVEPTSDGVVAVGEPSSFAETFKAVAQQ